MPSLRKRVSTYLRQLSFHNEPREKRNNINENAFVTNYLQGQITLQEGPPIIYGKNPTDLPSYDLGKYDSGPNTILGCYSGPNGGLTTVKRIEKHLSVADEDIDFIDNPDEEDPIPQPLPKKSPKRISGQPIDNTTMVIKVAGHEYCVTNKPKRHSKSYSLGSIAEFNIEVEKTKIEKDFYGCDRKRDENSNSETTKCKEGKSKCDTSDDFEIKKCEGSIKYEQQSLIDHTNPNTNINKIQIKSHGNISKEERNKSTKPKAQSSTNTSSIAAESRRISKTASKSQTESSRSNAKENYSLSKSRSDGNPFNNRKRGKIIQVQRAQTQKGIKVLPGMGFAVI